MHVAVERPVDDHRLEPGLGPPAQDQLTVEAQSRMASNSSIGMPVMRSMQIMWGPQ